MPANDPAQSTARDQDRVPASLRAQLEPRILRNLLASGGTFITLISSGLAAAFGGFLAILTGLPPLAIGIIAALFGVSFLITSAFLGRRNYGRIKRSVLFPGPVASD